MLLYMYRSQIAVCGLLLTLFLYAMLVSAHGLAAPRFSLDDTDHIQRTNGYGLRSISDVLAGRKYAILTFDDGPYGYGLDERIVRTLQKHHAHAVFFIACSHINSANRDVLSQLENDGNLIGSQTDAGASSATLSRSDIAHQVESCNQRLTQLTGKRPYYFRAPSGLTSKQEADVVLSFGIKQMSWNADIADNWMTKSSEILDARLSQIENQSIVLLHETPATADQLDGVLTKLEERGFQFELPEQRIANAAID